MWFTISFKILKRGWILMKYCKILDLNQKIRYLWEKMMGTLPWGGNVGQECLFGLIFCSLLWEDSGVTFTITIFMKGQTKCNTHGTTWMNLQSLNFLKAPFQETICKKKFLYCNRHFNDKYLMIENREIHNIYGILQH